MALSASRFGISRNFQTQANNKFPHITVMRHAESVGNISPKCVQGGSTDPRFCLSVDGRMSARLNLVKMPKPNVLITSGLLRCRQTAEEWFGCEFEKIPVRKITEPALKEINAGIFEGRYVDELKDEEIWRLWMSKPLEFPGFPNGETLGEFQSRVLGGFAKICAQHSDPSQHVCVIAHGIVMRVLKCFLAERDLSHLWKYDVVNLERVDLTREHVERLQCINPGHEERVRATNAIFYR